MVAGCIAVATLGIAILVWRRVSGRAVYSNVPRFPGDDMNALNGAGAGDGFFIEDRPATALNGDYERFNRITYGR
jgi:hypothetical protein